MINIVGDMSGKPKGYVPRGKKNTAVVAATEEVKKEHAGLPPTGQLEAVATVFKSPAAMAAPLPNAAIGKAMVAVPPMPVGAPMAAQPPSAKKDVSAAMPAKKAVSTPAAMAAQQPSALPAAEADDSTPDIPGRRYRTPRLAPGKEAARVSKYIRESEFVGPYLQAFMNELDKNEAADPYETTEAVYMPPTRKAFNDFIRDTFSEKFTLPIQTVADKSNACQKLFESAGKAGVESFLYQDFVREYIRQASPYRGMLVYHGLGSGKTCSAIAAAESLYSISDKKIIVMTPFSLRGNFLNEIAFCGFSHYRLNNYWVGIPVAKSSTLRLFAAKVLGVGTEYIDRMMANAADEEKLVWLPDFRTEAERSADPDDPAVYYTDLPTEAQAKIRAQINAIISNRFEFINYNGVTAKQLKAWACEATTTGVSKFDNAVIVIDEIHNLIRLMVGTIIPYMVARPGGRRRMPVETVTSERWKPELCVKPDRNYKRGYLFYRLLTDARNSKIIGLSGTPIVNFPEELGVLSTVLAGYIHCARISIPRDMAAAKTLQGILDAHPRIDYVKSDVADKNIVFTVSAFPEGYMAVYGQIPKRSAGAAEGYLKVQEGDNFRGIRYTDEEEAQTSIVGIVEEIKASGLPIVSVEYKSEPRLPYDDDTFRPAFIGDKGLNPANELVLKKRLTGLISYYKGSKEEYMPRILSDEIVPCEMSSHVFTTYNDVRIDEIETDKSKAETTKDLFHLVEVMSKASSVSSYRFKSRAACNYVFPDAIKRPMPGDASDMSFLDEMAEDDAVIDRGDVAEDLGRESAVEDTDAADAAAAAAVREEDASTEAPEEEAPEEAPGLAATIAKAAASVVAGVTATPAKGVTSTKLTYQDLLEAAMNQLDEQRDSYFKLDPAAPAEQQLRTYSPKLAAMLTRIEAAPGSSLVYSQFKTVEGLGVLGIALKAAGYTEIKIVGSGEAGFRFDDETRASILQGPSAKRFIKFTGEGTREQRALVLNIFNGHFSKLPAQIKEVFDEYDTTVAAFEGKPTYAESRNLSGGICRVIGITGAGAEGISLKCVRAVHIFESYWNNVRLEQVKGRAIRICSHADLPVEERNVRIYTYISKFSEAQLKGTPDPVTGATLQINEVIRLKDRMSMGGPVLTSDQFVLEVSSQKQKIIDDLFKVMKECAVDCTLNAADNTDVDACFTMEGTSRQYSFIPNLLADIQDTATDKRAAAVAEASVVAPAKSVVDQTGELKPAKGKRRELKVVALPGPDLALGKYALKPHETDPNKFYIYGTKVNEKGQVTGATGDKLGVAIENPATGGLRTTWYGAPAAAGK